jgi:hypothetical protein
VNSAVKRGEAAVAYRSLRVEEGTKKKAEEVPNDEVGLSNPFIKRSLQQNE